MPNRIEAIPETKMLDSCHLSRKVELFVQVKLVPQLQSILLANLAPDALKLRLCQSFCFRHKNIDLLLKFEVLPNLHPILLVQCLNIHRLFILIFFVRECYYDPAG